MKEEDSLKAQIVTLVREIDTLKLKGVVGNKQVIKVRFMKNAKFAMTLGILPRIAQSCLVW